MASFPSNERFFYYLEVMARRNFVVCIELPKKKKKRKKEEEVPSVMTFFYGILYLWFEFYLSSPSLFTSKNNK